MAAKWLSALGNAFRYYNMDDEERKQFRNMEAYYRQAAERQKQEQDAIIKEADEEAARLDQEWTNFYEQWDTKMEQLNTKMGAANTDDERSLLQDEKSRLDSDYNTALQNINANRSKVKEKREQAVSQKGSIDLYSPDWRATVAEDFDASNDYTGDPPKTGIKQSQKSKSNSDSEEDEEEDEGKEGSVLGTVLGAVGNSLGASIYGKLTQSGVDPSGVSASDRRIAELQEQNAADLQRASQQSAQIANRNYRDEAEKNAAAQAAQENQQKVTNLGNASAGAAALARGTKQAEYDTHMNRADTQREKAFDYLGRSNAARQLAEQSRVFAKNRDYAAGDRAQYNWDASRLSLGPGIANKIKGTDPDPDEEITEEKTQQQETMTYQDLINYVTGIPQDIEGNYSPNFDAAKALEYLDIAITSIANGNSDIENNRRNLKEPLSAEDRQTFLANNSDRYVSVNPEGGEHDVQDTVSWANIYKEFKGPGAAELIDFLVALRNAKVGQDAKGFNNRWDDVIDINALRGNPDQSSSRQNNGG